MKLAPETFTAYWADGYGGSHRLHVQYDESIDEVTVVVTEDDKRSTQFSLNTAQAAHLASLLARYVADHI